MGPPAVFSRAFPAGCWPPFRLNVKLSVPDDPGEFRHTGSLRVRVAKLDSMRLTLFACGRAMRTDVAAAIQSRCRCGGVSPVPVQIPTST